MMNKLALLLLILASTSCKDVFDANYQSFTKIYGTNLGSNLDGSFETNDGGFILYGGMNHNIQDGNVYTESGTVPTVIKTDRFGNVVNQRSYPFTEIVFKYRPPSILPDTIEVDRGWFRGMVPLSNGNYFATARFHSVLFDAHAEAWIILDRNLNLIEIEWLNDQETANPLNKPSWWRHHGTQVYEMPNSDDIIIKVRWAGDFNATTYASGFGGTHALYRMTMDGEIKWVEHYNQVNGLRTDGMDITFDKSGDIILVGWLIDDIGAGSCNQLFIEKIDNETGNLIGNQELLAVQETLLLDPVSNVPVAVIELEDNFIVQLYSRKKFPGDNECNSIDFSQPDKNNPEFGSLLILDNLFNILNRVDLAENLEAFFPSGIHGTMLKAQDGDIVSGFITVNLDGTRGLVIIKTDPEGNEIWRYNDHRGTIVSIAEASDGAIFIGAITNSSFDSRGSWLLIKLTHDGQLN